MCANDRCSKCTDRLEQERLKRLARTPGADRATRMDDMSSDDDDVSSGMISPSLFLYTTRRLFSNIGETLLASPFLCSKITTETLK